MQVVEQLRAFLIGKSYASFSVASAFGFGFDSFALAAQDVLCPDEDIINSIFVNSYAPAAKTGGPE
jgi:hypothetical protein